MRAVAAGVWMKLLCNEVTKKRKHGQVAKFISAGLVGC